MIITSSTTIYSNLVKIITKYSVTVRFLAWTVSL